MYVYTVCEQCASIHVQSHSEMPHVLGMRLCTMYIVHVFTDDEH